MQLKLERQKSSENNTLGSLFIDGELECYTLEDVVRDKKVYGNTAIAAGSYKIQLSYSPRFKQFLPELLEVPEFTGIRIHAGNSEHDTEGCILVGCRIVFGKLWQSKKALDKLSYKIMQVPRDENITIEIVNAGAFNEYSN